MLDRVTISNRALGKTGSTAKISSPDEDSHAASTIRAAWDAARMQVLRGAPKHQPRWNFAERYVVSPGRAIDDDAPLPQEFAGAYPAPDGALRLCEIVTPDCTAEGSYKYAGGEILIKASGPVGAWWLFDVTDTAKWDALFEDAFAALLAFEICDEINGDVGRKDRCWAEYLAKVASAAKVDAGESPPPEPEEDSWITARDVGGGYGWRRR